MWLFFGTGSWRSHLGPWLLEGVMYLHKTPIGPRYASYEVVSELGESM
jgi:hypothetical protein